VISPQVEAVGQDEDNAARYWFSSIFKTWAIFQYREALIALLGECTAPFDLDSRFATEAIHLFGPVPAGTPATRCAAIKFTAPSCQRRVVAEVCHWLFSTQPTLYLRDCYYELLRDQERFINFIGKRRKGWSFPNRYKIARHAKKLLKYQLFRENFGDYFDGERGDAIYYRIGNDADLHSDEEVQYREQFLEDFLESMMLHHSDKISQGSIFQLAVEIEKEFDRAAAEANAPAPPTTAPPAAAQPPVAAPVGVPAHDEHAEAAPASAPAPGPAAAPADANAGQDLFRRVLGPAQQMPQAEPAPAPAPAPPAAAPALPRDALVPRRQTRSQTHRADAISEAPSSRRQTLEAGSALAPPAMRLQDVTGTLALPSPDKLELAPAPAPAPGVDLPPVPEPAGEPGAQGVATGDLIGAFSPVPPELPRTTPAAMARCLLDASPPPPPPVPPSSPPPPSPPISSRVVAELDARSPPDAPTSAPRTPVAAALRRSHALAPRDATTADAPPAQTPDARPPGPFDEHKSVTPEHELRARISRLESEKEEVNRKHEGERKHAREAMLACRKLTCEIESLKLELDRMRAKSAAAEASNALDAPGTPSKKQTADRGTSPLANVN